jgi:hypothetical protein
MAESIAFMDLSNSQTSEATVEIFDPPMCCPTGMCGPTIDQALLNVNEMILTLQSDDVSVVRYQMTSHPQAFLNNADVMRLVREQQMAALPITVVRGKVIKAGEYPTLTEIKSNLNGASK